MARQRLTLADTGASGTVACKVPVHDKRLGWIVKDRPVAVHGSADDARAFAAAIMSSWSAHHAAWLARVAPAPVEAPASLACPSCGRVGFRKRGAGLAWHVERCTGRAAA